MNAPLDLDWSTANQQLLVAEFARLRALLGDGDLAAAQAGVAHAAACMPAPAALDHLTERFALSRFERDIVLLAAGVEMDMQLARRCREATGSPFPTFGLALAVLPEAHWSALAPLSPLRRWRLVEVDEKAGLTGGRVVLDERVLHYLAGLNDLDHRLHSLIEPVAEARLMAPAHMEAAMGLATMLQSTFGATRIVQLAGDDPLAQEDVARIIADVLRLRLYRLHAANIPEGLHECAALATLWQREAALLGSTLLIVDADSHTDAVRKLASSLHGLVLVATREPIALALPTHLLRIDKPDMPSQRELWRAALGVAADGLDDDIDQLASGYRLSARRIGDISIDVGPLAAEERRSMLHRQCRGDDAPLLALAQRIEPRAGWSDLILPETQRRALEQITVHTRQRIRVHHDWGFADRSDRGLGVATLFAGESGTGKTMAAEVLAKTLGLALYRIDLSAVVSKYIGETEKNLRKVFDAAEDIGAILLFDEADALFGKRSDVKDSHDRYANIEVSYLLQRMEAYRGLAILTTNHKSALDSAFSRRLRFVVNFPFPDTAQREAIWRGVFPPQTPVEALDHSKLARLNLAGGNIRNIALAAAFLAAEAGTPVTMPLLRHAARLEAAKRDKPFAEAEVRGWS
ncbi:ATP-binding protein [Aquipseudomonas alcaligenes]|uniref:ATP-binding protein n=1 Tax=Aquipseudomonas alcaligenes TaxID=43263 RepID=A0AA42SVX6_AQUAC|nr:ATP-binding protein [Pseudomonas alcaligenes]MDH1057076.1 ATP-binding protein [Pseudomonas alcaligenes]